jgi:LysR family hca operon transcriptional activator
LLPPSVVSRPIRGVPPTIDLVIGYNDANTSPVLRLFLSKVDELKERASRLHPPWHWPAAAGTI